MRARTEASLYFLIALVLISACSGLPKSQRPEPPPPQISTKIDAPTHAPSTARPTPAPVRENRSVPKLVFLDHKYFQVYYDPKIRLPRSVVYTLTAEHLRVATTKRHDRFRADPLLIEKDQPYVDKKEYVRSGYDKGHMAPFKDFAWSSEGGEETFVMSNMVPQKPKLNQQAWEDLEEDVRHWACGEEKLTVLTGPLIEEGLATLESGLPIPRRFYKVLIDETPPKKTIGFIYEQTDNRKGLAQNRIVSGQQIEKESGLDFKKIAPTWEEGLARAPSSLNDWKSEDCVGRASLKRMGDEE